MPVRAVETITASRTDISISSNEYQTEPFGGQSGLVLAFDLYRHGVAQQQLAGRFLVDRVKPKAAADALAALNRRDEAHAVEPVIHGHFDMLGNEHAVRSHV